MNIKNNINKEITISGYVESIRDLQYVQFVIIRNNLERLQITLEKSDEKLKDLIEVISSLTLESTVKVTGMLLENEKVKLNGVELIPSSIEVTSRSKEELPISIKSKESANRETRLDYRFLDLRRDDNLMLFKFKTELLNNMRTHFVNNDFIEINTPKISAKNAESGAEVFELDYFGKKASLSQSPQLYKQMAIASGFNKVFEIGPAFRAENSHTSYHAAEIEMLDVEMGFINSLDDIMDVHEDLLKESINKTIDKYGEEVSKYFNINLEKQTEKFPRITFAECKQILKEEYKYVSEKQDDLDKTEEEYISDWAKKNHKSDFIFIYEWPYAGRPFYHHKNKAGNSVSYDLIYKGVEVSTGAVRENIHEVLINQIKEKDVNPEDLKFYTTFFEYGIPPHGGFGFGVARLIMKIFEIDNIREATFIYRGPTRLNP